MSDLPLTRPDGTRFTVSLTRGDASGPVLLVCPAMGVQAGYYDRFAEQLAATGLSVAVTESRGHEAVDRVRPSRRVDFGYADMLADMEQASAAVRDACPGQPLILVGHSLGGQLATAYVGRHPDEVAGLVLVAAGTVHWRRISAPFLPASQAIGLLARLLGHFPGDRLRFAGREARTVMTDWARLGRTGRLEFGTPRVDHTPAAGRVAIDVLAISLEGDRFAPASAVDGLAEILASADVTRRHLTEGEIDHLRWVRRPAHVVAAIEAWLASRR